MISCNNFVKLRKTSVLEITLKKKEKYGFRHLTSFHHQRHFHRLNYHPKESNSAHCGRIRPYKYRVHSIPVKTVLNRN